MKTIIIFILCFAALSAFGQTSGSPDQSVRTGYSDFEIVESIPIETTLDNADIRNTHEVWIEMINGAKKALDIEQFYVSPQKGEPLDDIITAIIAAGERGVAIRFIVDARMYKTYPETVDMLGKQKNISVRIIDFGKLLGTGVQHAKYFIVDGEEIFLGSQNFDWRALKHIHELGVRIRHAEAVKIYSDIFDYDWQLAEHNKLFPAERQQYPTSFTIKYPSNEQLTFIPTMSPRNLIPDEELWDEKHIVPLIDSAKKEVVLQFLSYSPIGRDKSFYSVLENSLRRAAARGVDVRMIVSDWEKDHPTVDYLKSLTLIPNIDVKFSVIPEWSGGYIPFARVEHCKYICADASSFWLGTSNAEKSYFYTSRNLGVIVHNNKLASNIHRIFTKSWDGPYMEEIKPEIEYTPRKHNE